jgi:hypothetical protein
MKKEIKTQFVSLFASIDGVSKALREELQNQNARITEQGNEIKIIKAKVEALGKPT